MKIKSYKQAVRYLESFIGKIIFKVDAEFLKNHDPLERMRVLLDLLGNPQEKFRSVLVGGTSGKGSTAYLLSHILTTAGYKTGFTISPHLQKANERLQINGQSISDEEFTNRVALMIRIIETMKKMPARNASSPASQAVRGGLGASVAGGKIGSPARHRLAKASAGGPSYFEILIGMAFTYFADQKVDIAAVEVGMGGEFDATNTLNPLIAVLTNVGLDHTNVLGKTVEKIAKTKAGIIKTRGPVGTPLVVISGVKQASVIKIVEDRCERVGAELNLLWRDFGYKIKKESVSGTDFDFISHEETLGDLKLSLLGQYQAENASLAIKTVLELQKLGFKITDEAIKKALKTAFFPGRFEIVRSPVGFHPRPTSSLTSLRSGARRGAPVPATPLIILDGAHNPTKMKEFLKSLKKIFPTQEKVFIIGFKFDKDIPKMLKEITKLADKIIVTQFKAKTDMNIHASASAEDLKTQIAKLKSGTKVIVEKNSKKALALALNILISQYPNIPSAVVVTGSLYLVGEIRNKISLF